MLLNYQKVESKYQASFGGIIWGQNPTDLHDPHILYYMYMMIPIDCKITIFSLCLFVCFENMIIMVG